MTAGSQISRPESALTEYSDDQSLAANICASKGHPAATFPADATGAAPSDMPGEHNREENGNYGPSVQLNASHATVAHTEHQSAETSTVTNDSTEKTT